MDRVLIWWLLSQQICDRDKTGTKRCSLSHFLGRSCETGTNVSFIDIITDNRDELLAAGRRIFGISVY